MAVKPRKPNPATSPPRTKTTSVTPEQVLADPLADVPLFGPVTDRFEIQPGDITLITVGSIEVVTYPSPEEDETKPTTPPAAQPGKKPKDKA